MLRNIIPPTRDKKYTGAPLPQLVTPHDNASVVTGAGTSLARLMQKGRQEATQGTEVQAQEQQQEGASGIQEVTGGNGGNAGNAPDFEKAIAERDEKIASLEAQVAEAAKTTEAAEKLRGEVAEVKARAESDRIDFKLQLAGVRNVKAARALLSDYDNNVDKLKEAEPWLFETTGKHAKGGSSGTTGLPNAGGRVRQGQDSQALARDRRAR